MNPALRSLASGSSGNCYVLRGSGGLLLVDAGLSRRELLRRMELVGLDPNRLRGILLSHEHGDHMAGAPVLARQLGIPVHLSSGTKAASRSRWSGREDLRVVKPGDEWELSGFRIRAFSVSHDASEALQYRVESDGVRMAVCTDLGRATVEVKQALRGCQLLALEANHDLELLQNGPYPWPLKQRIRGTHGHLSNEQCLGLLREVAWPGLRHVLLAHLSKENNRPELALDTVCSGLGTALGHVRVSVAAPDKPSPWLQAAAAVEGSDAFGDLPLFA